MGKNWAIAVGINNYDNLQSLKYAQRDAEVMKAWFEKEARFDQVFLFTENSPPIPASKPILTKPTYARFKRFLNVQFEDPLLQPEDNLWFFFAGHGRRYQDQDYLMFEDSDPEGVNTTAISVNYVVERLRRCGADNVVLLIDACRDEGSRSGSGIGLEEHKGVITFYSCRANQQSFEIDELQHGAFTHTLLEGLRLQGEFNCATVERLNQYLCSNVPEINSRYQKPVQNPYLKAEPPYKLYLPLLKQGVRLQDVTQLKNQAYRAEYKDIFLARQLWKRIIAAVGYDSEAFESIERIAVRINGEGIKPNIAVTQPVSKSSDSSRGNNIQSSTLDNNPIEQEDTLETSTQKNNKFNKPTFSFEVVTVDRRGEEINRERREAEYFTEDLGSGVSLDMVYIPAGHFRMGTEDAEIERLVKKFDVNWFRAEKPQHQVNVPAFCMGKYPITQSQWKRVAALPKINCDLKPEPSYFKGDNRPVEQVSWYDAVEFCARLSKATGREYRLPSEAEWEYVCRAGTTTPFHFGETITTDLANYRGTDWEYKGKIYPGNYGQEPKGIFREETTEVGQFPPNTFGLYDMHGNVLEWCEDTLHNNYNGAPTDGSAWIHNDNDNHYRMLRGGSWYTLPMNCRSAYRNLNIPDNRVNHLGFRVVVVLA